MTILRQRSAEWRQIRCGEITASRFKDILTPPKTKADKEAGVMSATAKRYFEEKLAELLTCEPNKDFLVDATRWGIEWEREAFKEAVAHIERTLGLPVQSPVDEFAYIRHETEPMIGCSPDGLIGDDGGLELKCPYNPAVSVRTRLEGFMPDEHQAQIQGTLWCTGRKWYMFGSYDPRMKNSNVDPLFSQRIERDDEYIETILAPAVLSFRNQLLKTYHSMLPGAPF